MQHATVLRTAVVAAFNSSSKSACQDSSSFPHLVSMDEAMCCLRWVSLHLYLN